MVISWTRMARVAALRGTARPHHFEQSLTVWMFVQGRWIPVPNNEIQYRTLLGDDGQTGGGHWCGWALDPTGPTGDSRAHTICAVLPRFRSGGYSRRIALRVHVGFSGSVSRGPVHDDVHRDGQFATSYRET